MNSTSFRALSVVLISVRPTPSDAIRWANGAIVVNIDGRHPRISTLPSLGIDDVIPGYRRTPSPDIDNVIPGYIDAAILYDNSANGAMAKFTFSGRVGKTQGLPVTIETSMTEADFSKKLLGASGAIMLAAFLPKCQ